METLCSLLIGQEGNNGYRCVGRVKDLNKEESRINGEY
jgi:hypothetical protein